MLHVKCLYVNQEKEEEKNIARLGEKGRPTEIFNTRLINLH